ncbi:hypothetical protein MMPV_006797 [Pyropia vietnamensis]
MGHGRPRNSMYRATVVALSSCFLLLVALLGWAVAAPAPAPASPPSPPVASVVVHTPPPGTPAEPQASSVSERLALAGIAMVRMAGAVGHRVVAISNTRLDQLFASKAERLTVAGASRVGVAEGADGGGSTAGGAPASSTRATPVPPVTTAVVDAGTGPKRDRAANWAAVGLVLLFTLIALGILAPIVRSMRARKDLLPLRVEEYAGGAVLQ